MAKRSADGALKHLPPATVQSPSHLYDTSWTLHRVTWPTRAAGRASQDSLLLPSSQRALDRRARQLREYLAIDDWVGMSEAEDVLGRAGGLKSCSWQRVEGGDVYRGGEGEGEDGDDEARLRRDGGAEREDRSPQPLGIQITLGFEKTTYKVVLLALCEEVGASNGSENEDHDDDDDDDDDYTASYNLPREPNPTPPPPPLLLTKTPAPLTKKILAFLSETFDATIQPLKLSSLFLQSCLHAYLDVVCSVPRATSLVAQAVVIATGRELQPPLLLLVREVIKDLKITLSFAGTVATSGLKTIDVELPANTVVNILEAASSSSSSSHRSSNTAASTATPSPSSSFMTVLGSHIHHHTGLKLPSPPPPSSANDNDDQIRDDDAPIRVSRLVCGAFAIGAEGRLKLVGKAVDAAEADDMGELVEIANRQLLNMLIQEAQVPGKRRKY